MSREEGSPIIHRGSRNAVATRNSHLVVGRSTKMISIVAISACIAASVTIDTMSLLVDSWWRGFVVCSLCWVTAAAIALDVFRAAKRNVW